MIRKISIAANSSEGFLKKVAQELDLGLTKDNREFSINLSEDLGHGYMKAYGFDHGISVFEVDCTLTKEIHLVFEKAVVRPLLMVFNREEEIFVSGKNTGNRTINHLDSFMGSEGMQKKFELILKAKVPTCFFALVIDRKQFEEKIDGFLNEMHPSLVEIFRDVNGVNHFYTQGYYSLDIAKYIEEFTTTELTEFMRYVFLEGKVYEILTHYLKQYLDDLEDPDNRKILRQQTVNKIEEASNIIREEIELLGSIISLAKRVGLNQNTLQEGFKQLYKKSVNQYIREVRLEKAKELLESSDLNITEITYNIGINSRSYFSKIFKQQFGVSPKDYILKHRKKGNRDKTA
ncbi:helix-turn-helix transcriptional regulator [Flagellimonas sp. 389]|uniref:helix-turn-helix domain-containing protein n=1 Tax=Flagellimonas sp. 389 TaxID=2835862 RepID=UPI001BD2D564|nr:AraC family transcriptional regulator [Flagellimonas sp. 389]MBS9464294.1 helix-turn-helix transcriptional regulator [Flagellimonas sp. 389]